MSMNRPAVRFESFVRDYGERAFQFAYRLSGNIDEAKDLVQESFRRAMSHWASYDDSRNLEAWYCTILRHVYIDGRKRYEARNAVSFDAPVNEDHATVGDLLASEEEAALVFLERKEKAAAVRALLGKLPYDLRVILTLCDMQGLCYEQAAEALDIPSGTVRSRLNRARILFRRIAARSLEVDA